jgi:tryptophan-rich sensory protein
MSYSAARSVMMPLAAWAGYASVLNAAMWWLNR